MQTNAINQGMSILWLPPKLILAMKLIIVLIIASLTQVSAAGFAQKVSLKEKNATIKSLIDKIRHQTGYDLVFDTRIISANSKMDIDVRQMDLESVLKIILKDQDVEFTINDKVIVFQRREKTFFDKLAEKFAAIDFGGVVLDETGNPLPGATVTIKGKSIRTITNEKGQFNLKDISSGDILVISYVGYKTNEVLVPENDGYIVIKLTTDAANLEGVSVVSTGYQSLPKERATGAFKVLSREQLDKPATNIAQRLIGTTAGLQSTLDVNGNPSLRVRGQTSLNASSDPLVVVDGFPVQDSFNSINPNNIETITILKDAAAASIWGARSANGVIVITTKSGKKGIPLKIDVSAFTRVGEKMDLDYIRPQATSAETVEFEKLAFGKWGAITNTGTIANIGVPWGPAYTLMNEHAIGNITLEQREAGLERLKTFNNKSQIENLLLKAPVTNQVNLNITGSTNKMNNAVSILYERNQFDFRGNDNKKGILNYRTDVNVLKWLDFDLNTMVQYQTNNNNGISLSDLQSILPYEMLQNESGSYLDVVRNYYTPSLQRLVPTAKFPYPDFSYNPLREVNARRFGSESVNARVQAGLTAKIISGLSISSKIQYENFNTTTRNLALEDSYQVRNTVNQSVTWNRTATGAVTANLPKGAILDQNRSKAEGYVFRNQLNYNEHFGTDHSINFIAGTEIRNTVSQTFNNPTTYGYNDETLAVGGFPNGPGGRFPSFPTYSLTGWLGNALTYGYTNSFSYRTDRYFSSFGNLGYTYKEKYTLSGSFRTDASNLIAEDPKFRYSPFWSVGGSWQVSKETFLSGLTWLDKLTARITYGYNGNEDRSTSPTPLINISSTPNSLTNETTATIGSFGNPTLRWEKTGTVNAGLDFSLFKGKFYGAIDVYNKKGKDLLANLSIPSANGTTTQRLNNVEMYNRGIDLDLGTSHNIGSKINWRGNVTFSYNENKITNLFVVRYTGATLRQGGSGAYVEGLNANTLWAYQYAGLLNGVPVVKGEGDALYNSTSTPSADGRTFMKNAGVSVAPYTLGFINSFDIYDFNLSFIVTGKFGHVFRRLSFNYPSADFGKSIPNGRLSEVLNGDPNSIVTLPANDNEPNYRSWGSGYVPYMDYLVENASHLRLQELNLSYNIKPELLKKFRITGVRLFAQANNLFTIVNNKYGEDPEYPVGTQRPQPRFSFGFKLEL